MGATDRDFPSPPRDVQVAALHNYRYEGHSLYTAQTVELPLGWTRSIISIHRKALIVSSIHDTSGKCESILYARTKLRLCNTPGFPSMPVYFNPANAPFEIRPSGSKRIGWFATRPLQVGDLIHLERPLLVVPVYTDLSGVKDCPHYIRSYTKVFQQSNNSVANVMEALLNVAYGRMTKENQDAYMALRSGHRCLEAGLKLSSIFGMNVYEFLGLATDREGDKYGAVLKDMSRINHSCRPNCAHNFSPDFFMLELRATRAINPGEEILYSYCDPCLPREFRQEHLKVHYGFLCSCISCVTTPLIHATISFAGRSQLGWTLCLRDTMNSKKVTRDNSRMAYRFTNRAFPLCVIWNRKGWMVMGCIRER